MACRRQDVTDLGDNATMGRFNLFVRNSFVRVINEGGLDFCQQGRLVALDRQQVVAALLMILAAMSR